MTKPLAPYEVKREAWLTALETNGGRECYQAFCEVLPMDRYPQRRGYFTVGDLNSQERADRRYKVCAVSLLAEVLGDDPIEMFYGGGGSIKEGGWFPRLAKQLNVKPLLLDAVVNLMDGKGYTFKQIADNLRLHWDDQPTGPDGVASPGV